MANAVFILYKKRGTGNCAEGAEAQPSYEYPRSVGFSRTPRFTVCFTKAFVLFLEIRPLQPPPPLKQKEILASSGEREGGREQRGEGMRSGGGRKEGRSGSTSRWPPLVFRENRGGEGCPSGLRGEAGAPWRLVTKWAELLPGSGRVS